MFEPAPNPELLRSLGHLVRGLSVLFWGLPLALVVCVQTSHTDYLRLFGIVPPLLVTAVPAYGLILLGRFHKEETVWTTAVERARLLAVVNLGLSPFLFWWSRMPSNTFFGAMGATMTLTGLLFLLALGPVLRRLTAMLPDEALRHETVLFTRMTTVLVGLILVLAAGSFVLRHVKPPFHLTPFWTSFLDRAASRAAWGGWFLILLSVAMTMALLWKIKDAIFQSVFGGSR